MRYVLPLDLELRRVYPLADGVVVIFRRNVSRKELGL